MADPDRAALLAQAYSRGLLPPDQRQAYEEAARRGIVHDQAAAAAGFEAVQSGIFAGAPHANATAGVGAGGRVHPSSAEQAQQRYGTAPMETFSGRPQERAFTTQMTSNMGVGDERSGLFAAGIQGVENVGRRIAGQPVEISTRDAYHAAAERDRREQAQYAQEHPIANAAATGLGLAVAGAPNGARVVTVAPALARLGRFGRAAQAGVNAAVANIPYAFANQEGDVADRIPGTIEDTALAFGAGGLLHAGAQQLRGLARVRRANPSPQSRLAAEGVTLTPGQMLGGPFRRAEDAATSTPVVGDVIRNAQNRGVESFDRAAINRSLAPIGQTLPRNVDVGRQGLAHAETAISDHYTRHLSGVTIRPDARFVSEVQRAASRLPPGQARQDFVSIIQDTVGNRFNGPVPGQEWKQIDSELGAAIRSAEAGSATNPAQRPLRSALIAAQRAFRGTLQRTDAAVAAQVARGDAATANLVRIRQASQMVGTAAEGGRFTPAQLNNAVRATDSSAGHRAYARGDALMQDLTEPGMQVLPRTVPDSGTPLRQAVQFGVPAAAGLLGAEHLGVPGAGAAAGVGAAAAGATAVVYSRPVQWALNLIFQAGARAPRGQVAEALSVLSREAARNPALVPLLDRARAQVAQPGAQIQPTAAPTPATAQ